MADGKTVVISARFTEAEAAEIDAARGEVSRAAWVQQAITGRLAGTRRVTVPVTPQDSMASVFSSPEYLRHLQRVVQETVLKYAEMNPAGGPSPWNPGNGEPGPETPRKPRAKGPCEHRVPPGSYCARCKRLI